MLPRRGKRFWKGWSRALPANWLPCLNRGRFFFPGRLCRSEVIQTELTNRLQKFGPVRRVSGIAEVAKEAAQGAALIADGMAGGQYVDLVETMQLRKASGTVLDYLHVNQADALRQKYLGATA